jgi:general secretion pathway protein B
MSFILDALQKSERERHAGQAPAIDEALSRPPSDPARTRRRGEAALMIRTALAVAAVFLIAGLTWWLLSRGQAAPEQIATPPPAPAPLASAPSEPEPASATSEIEAAPALRVDPERLAAPLATDLGPDAATLDELLDETPEQTPAVAAEPAPVVVDAAPQAVAVVEPPPPAPPAPVARSPEPMPLKDMPPSFRSEFPALSVQVHVYDPNPLRRFVLINGKKYRETDTLVEGPKVIEIVPEGVVLEHRGTRVLQEMPH